MTLRFAGTSGPPTVLPKLKFSTLANFRPASGCIPVLPGGLFSGENKKR